MKKEGNSIFVGKLVIHWYEDDFGIEVENLDAEKLDAISKLESIGISAEGRMKVIAGSEYDG